MASTLETPRLLEKQIAWANRAILGGMSTEAALFAAKIENLWAERHHGERVPLARAIWAPLDRAPLAQRPPGMKRLPPGAVRLLPLETSYDRVGIGHFFHNLVNGEYTTLELVSRSMYEHPDMPPGFYLALAFYGAQRFVWEFMKPYGALIGPLTLFHLLSLSVLLYAVVMLATAPAVRSTHERAAA